MEELTRYEVDFIRSMRARGFAVIVWTPDELGDNMADDVEDWSIQHAQEAFDLGIGDNL